jgi:GTPase
LALELMSDKNWTLGEKKRQKRTQGVERAVLVGLVHGHQKEPKVIEHLDELEFLAETAGAQTVKRFMQKLGRPDSKTFIGKGKVQEVKEFIAEREIDMVIFDDDLTGKQTQILEKELEVKIVDRSMLILDIFASRAMTAQSRTQVELAQMQYLLPRLRGLWTHLERQKGGIGMRGPGEQEIETDRRIVRDKIALLKKQLEKIDKQSFTRRKQRGELIRVALVGYTNAGKSTLMNVLSKSDVFAEDKLFATLDTTVRKVVLDRTPCLLSDTVGFIRKLPHHLIESFKSTLDETRESDILIHMVDCSHPQFEDQIETVMGTLADLKVEDKPILMILNKIDLYRDRNFDDFLDKETRVHLEEELVARIKNQYDVAAIAISSKTRENIDALRLTLVEMVRAQYEVRYPYKTMYY